MAALGLGVAALGLLLGGGAPRFPLDRSAVGLAGLAPWLRERGVETKIFTGGVFPGATTGGRRSRWGAVGLRVLPLYDVDLTAASRPAGSAAARLAAQTERDVSQYVVRQKIVAAPTLVVLPKWRSGMRLTGEARAEYLISAEALDRVLAQLGAAAGPSRRFGVEAADRERVFTRFEVDTPEGPAVVTLPFAQTVAAGRCQPLIGDRDAMLFGACPGPFSGYWLLADPDLLNNHGLGLGENARVATAFLRTLAAGRPIVLDFSAALAGADGGAAGGTGSGGGGGSGGGRGGSAEAPAPTQAPSFFERVFSFPLTLLWAAAAVSGALALWRGAVRYGAAQRLTFDAPGASKAAALAAKARLLRLAGRDRAMVAAHIADRLQLLAAQALGPRAGRGDGAVALMRQALRRRDPTLADALDRFAAPGAGPPAEAGAAELMAYVRRFEATAKKVSDDFRRA